MHVHGWTMTVEKMHGNDTKDTLTKGFGSNDECHNNDVCQQCKCCEQQRLQKCCRRREKGCGDGWTCCHKSDNSNTIGQLFVSGVTEQLARCHRTLQPSRYSIIAHCALLASRATTHSNSASHKRCKGHECWQVKSCVPLVHASASCGYVVGCL